MTHQTDHRWYARPVLFVSDVHRALGFYVDGLSDLRRQLAERSVSSKDAWWGYDVLQVDDPDGNELQFPVSG